MTSPQAWDSEYQSLDILRMLKDLFIYKGLFSLLIYIKISGNKLIKAHIGNSANKFNVFDETQKHGTWLIFLGHKDIFPLLSLRQLNKDVLRMKGKIFIESSN